MTTSPILQRTILIESRLETKMTLFGIVFLAGTIAATVYFTSAH
ncbi:MAG TPA: hypothetical protein VM689_14735 [Aliidongia sp.]|nr:hypothetical protein [Aliidongia sp.]